MATQAPDGQPPSLSREELEKALEGQSVEQLQEMGRRLQKSQDGMAELLALEEAEQSSLHEESQYLHETIDLMMKELHKLNIGSLNTSNPELQEGPLAFIGRHWEKVKPRDTAFQTSEHVGEIKKPIVTEATGVPPTAQEVAQQVKEQAGKQVLETAKNLQGKLGPLWQRTQGFLNEKQGELTGAVARAQARAQARAKAQQEDKKPAREKKRKQPRAEEPKSEGRSPASAAAAAPETFAPPERQSPKSTAGSASSTAPAPTLDVIEEKAEPAAEVPAAAAIAAAAEASAPAPTSPAGAAAAAAPTSPEAASGSGAADSAAGSDEQIGSTLLIEAKITIDDGSVLTLQVKAADRCKEVAQRFVQENSLKAWFQDPLTTWLKKVEADAVKFPVKVEGDLGEIRKQYSKAKNKA